jgi:hypothetical protein
MPGNTIPSTPPNIAWHPAFIQAFKLELEPYRDVLEFIPEYQLTSEPLRIDLAVIKKLKDIPIRKNIAAIFRSDNLVEYKSPGDYVSIADFYKVYGYASLYVAFTNVPITEITITFVENREPRKLLKHLKELRRCQVKKEESGIYRIEGDIIPIQVIDSRELSWEENFWLKGLREDLEAGEAAAILEAGRKKLKGMAIEAYLQAVLKANTGAVLEVGKMRKKTMSLDDVLIELGLTAKWKEEARKETAAEYEERLRQIQEQNRQVQEQNRRLEEENRLLRERR